MTAKKPEPADVTSINVAHVGTITYVGGLALECVAYDITGTNPQKGSCSFQRFFKVIGGTQILIKTFTIKVGQKFELNDETFLFAGERNGTFLFTPVKEE